jgi:hypothetical protein
MGSLRSCNDHARMELIILGGVAAGFVGGTCAALWVIAAVTIRPRAESDASQARRARR